MIGSTSMSHRRGSTELQLGHMLIDPPADGQELKLPRLEQPVLYQRGLPTEQLSLPCEARLIAADPRVEETRNQVAVMRGPVLYCVESPDLPAGIRVPSVYLASDATFRISPGLANSTLPLAAEIVTLDVQGLRRDESAWDKLYRPLSQDGLSPFDLRLIPYFAWSNRGPSAMSVWIPVVLKESGH